MITLDTAQDIAKVVDNWHQDNLLIIEERAQRASSSEEREIYDNIYDLLNTLPFNTNFSINEEVMQRTVEIIVDGHTLAPRNPIQ